MQRPVKLPKLQWYESSQNVYWIRMFVHYGRGGSHAQYVCTFLVLPPLPPHFNVGSGVATSGCRPFMLVTVWWPRQQSSPTLTWGGRGGRQGQIAKLEPHYIDSTEKGSSHTPLTDTGAAQQLASQPLKCKIAHSRFLLPGMDTPKRSSPY